MRVVELLCLKLLAHFIIKNLKSEESLFIPETGYLSSMRKGVLTDYIMILFEGIVHRRKSCQYKGVCIMAFFIKDKTVTSRLSTVSTFSLEDFWFDVLSRLYSNI